MDGERRRTYATYFWQAHDNNRAPCHFLQRTLTQFRLGKHGLGILHRHLPRIERDRMTCQYCTLQVIEDEYHFMLECPLYSEIRATRSHLFEHIAHVEPSNRLGRDEIGSNTDENGGNICLLLRGDETMRRLFGTQHQGELAIHIRQCLKKRQRTEPQFAPHR